MEGARLAMGGSSGAVGRLGMVLVVRVRLYRDGLAAMLRAHRQIDLLSCVGSVAEARPEIAAGTPDVVLLDMSVPGAASLVAQLASDGRPPHMVALGVEETEGAIIDSVEVGVEAFVNKSDSVADLIAIVEATARGELVCSARVAAILRRRVTTLGHSAASADGVPGLTARERDVASLIDMGLSNREIANRLNIEVSTVKNHLHNIFEKLGVNHRWEVTTHRDGAHAQVARIPVRIHDRAHIS